MPPALRRPSPLRSQIVLFRTWSEEPKKCRKIASQGVPNGAQNHKNLQNIHSGRPLKSKLGKTPQIVRILTPSNPLKRVKTNTKTQFSRFHPDTKKSQKWPPKGSFGEPVWDWKWKKCPPRGYQKKHQKIHRKISKNVEKMTQNWTGPA